MSMNRLLLSALELVSLCITTFAADRRILISDPSYVSQELNRLQSELQEVQVKVGAQQQTITSQQQSITSQQQTISALQQSVNNQQQTIVSQNLTLDHQQQTISKLQQSASNQQVIQVKVDAQQHLISTLQQSVSKLALKGDKGTVYTRWGRRDCPTGNDTQLVYSGYVGGSWYNDPGAANIVCLPEDPVFGPHQDGTLRYPSAIYGAEIEDDYALFGLPHRNEDVTCAVCRSSSHSTHIMIPGRTICYPGWAQAYNGLLTSGHPTQPGGTEYNCMDGHVQPVPGGGADNDGHVFYVVEAKCGSLKCPPYDNNKVMPCVVCLM